VAKQLWATISKLLKVEVGGSFDYIDKEFLIQLHFLCSFGNLEMDYYQHIVGLAQN